MELTENISVPFFYFILLLATIRPPMVNPVLWIDLFSEGVLDMPAWSLLVWLAIGAIAGLIARSFIGGTPPFGKIGDMILGIAGGVVGGYGVALLGVGGSGTIGGLIVTCVAALAGALLLVWLSKRIKVKQ